MVFPQWSGMDAGWTTSGEALNAPPQPPMYEKEEQKKSVQEVSQRLYL
jgi:hypothetical protein